MAHQNSKMRIKTGFNLGSRAKTAFSREILEDHHKTYRKVNQLDMGVQYNIA